MKHITLAAEMVRAILEGNKTQTRRPVKPQPQMEVLASGERMLVWTGGPFPMGPGANWSAYCPYGKPGDRLQVKNGPVVEVVSVRAERVQDISIRDALDEGIRCPDCGYTAKDAGTHMDHAVCVNKWLKESKVKDVGDHSAIGDFRALWGSIYGKKPDLNWNANPFVWVISFKVVS